MLAIRMQRTGRHGHASFRVVVQDSRQTPTSGKVVAFIGSYDPHTKLATLTKDKADFYLKNGAQPSERVARLFKQEGISLPTWVSLSSDKIRQTRNPQKLRKNQPDEPKPTDDAAPETLDNGKASTEAKTDEQTSDGSAKAIQPPEPNEPEVETDKASADKPSAN